LALGEHDPCGRCLFLDPGLSGPVVVLGSGELRFDLVEMCDLGAG
jgi:hypothetical protein